jgi:hypothetical protein
VEVRTDTSLPATGQPVAGSDLDRRSHTEILERRKLSSDIHNNDIITVIVEISDH